MSSCLQLFFNRPVDDALRFNTEAQESVYFRPPAHPNPVVKLTLEVYTSLIVLAFHLGFFARILPGFLKIFETKSQERCQNIERSRKIIPEIQDIY